MQSLNVMRYDAGITAQQICQPKTDFSCPYLDGYYAIIGDFHCSNYYQCFNGEKIEKVIQITRIK